MATSPVEEQFMTKVAEVDGDGGELRGLPDEVDLRGENYEEGRTLPKKTTEQAKVELTGGHPFNQDSDSKGMETTLKTTDGLAHGNKKEGDIKEGETRFELRGDSKDSEKVGARKEETARASLAQKDDFRSEHRPLAQRGNADENTIQEQTTEEIDTQQEQLLRIEEELGEVAIYPSK